MSPGARNLSKRLKFAAASACAVLASTATTSASAWEVPPIDFDGLGQLGVAGSFSGIQLWNQSTSTLTQQGAFNVSEGSLIALAADGNLTKIASTNQGGSIRAVCQRTAEPFTVFVGGNFSDINGTRVGNVASFDPATQRWDALAGGIDGLVNTLYCDEQHGTVIAGGTFLGPFRPRPDQAARFLGGVASWSYTGDVWSPVSFGGVNGTVETIALGSNVSSIRVVGNFTTEYSSRSSPNASLSGTNTSASSLTQALSPLPLGQSEFSGGPSSAVAAYANPAQLLCPRGEDGPNNSYHFADNAVGRLTLRAFRSLQTRAIRIGNTFVDGRGTRTFGVVSIPDNTDLTLIYLDPLTQQNVTCRGNCSLFHDAAVAPYQDFLIADVPENGAVNGTKLLTGIQFTATEWYGPGAGLHSLSLLSQGSFAYAFNGYNRGGCSSTQPGVNGTRSSSTSEGGWYRTHVPEVGVPAVVSPVLAITDRTANLPQNVGSSVTWNVDAHYNGNYSVFLSVPGCTATNSCDTRTDVQVTVFGNNTAGDGVSTFVSQNVPDDTQILVYDGEIMKSAGGFVPTVRLSIPGNATRPVSDTFNVIADRVTLNLRSSNETHPMFEARGFGMLEYNVFDTRDVPQFNATQMQTNLTFNAFSNFGSVLRSNGVAANDTMGQMIVTSSVTNRGSTFVGGNFTSLNASATVGFANIVSYTNTSGGSNFTRLSGGGVNGRVSSLSVVKDHLFIGGNYTSTFDNITQLPYVAEYDVIGSKWIPLAGGPDGPVETLTPLRETFLLVTGSFESLNKGAVPAGGYAIWDVIAKKWVPQEPFLVGNVLAASTPSNASGVAYLAGAIGGISKDSASGAVRIIPPNDDDQLPTIDTLNFRFESTRATSNMLPVPAAPAASSSALASAPLSSGAAPLSSSGAAPTSSGTAAPAEERSGTSVSRWLSWNARSNQQGGPLVSLSRRASAMEPAILATNGEDEIISSAFWKRGNNDFVYVLGGNFTTDAGIKNLAYYDEKTNLLKPFPALPRSSNLTVVRAVAVDGDTLYAGGDGGLAIFDFKANTWSSNLAALQATSRNVLSVQAIYHRPESSTMIIAGTFDEAGSLPCKNVCAWDTGSRRWSQLGAGIDGQISAIDYAGNHASLLLVAGSMTVNGAEASLAQWDFEAMTWTALGSVGVAGGEIPGPATALSVDDYNPRSIFVAGRTTDGRRPYLAKWNGQSYDSLAPGELLPDSGIAQLSFVGITRAHPDNPVLENNRMLVVSGALLMRDFGNVSTALFDGQLWTPYLQATSPSGGLGVVRAFTRSNEILSFPNLHHLAVGIVILISIAIGLGIVFLLVLIGLIWALSRRHPNRGVDVPISPSDDTLAMAGGAGAGEKRAPSELLATLNAATEGAIEQRGADSAGYAAAGAGAAGAGAAMAASTSHGHNRQESSAAHGGTLENSDETAGAASTAYHSERTGQSAYWSGEEGNPAAEAAAGGAVGAGAAATGIAYGGLDEVAGPGEGLEAHARYSFEATHPSELAVHAGQTIWILDDQDEHWWLAKDGQGNSGVLPATYVL
ncbi:hypothetical protein CBOM_06053 [Ceraceosorus bombacis]|uniref:SH3 domain-containing protein n=1 Tax=Ceraceosorus bombacis TaxID=401625 RepID=A0A0P1BIL5_9BASI|nr:hypothetical protein CBOM_06053 [Ceraceosorus bombacis]